MGNRTKIINAIALSHGKGIGPKVYKKLIDHLESATKVLNTPTRILQRELGLGPQQARNILETKNLIPEATRIYDQNTKLGISIIPYESSDYPRRLKQIYDPPKVLYCKHKNSLNPMRAVSIVGTRNASSYGISWVKDFVKELKDYDATVVSGLAYGIDFHAHKTALEEELPTFAVMAGGPTDIYPREHLPIAEKLIENGALISENMAHVMPERYNFPARNRIIVGVADAVVVVEAGKKSGALITAKYANEVDRDVFAVPGNIHKESSEGCNALIKKHEAHLITSVDDFADMMNWKSSQNTTTKRRKVIHMEELDAQEKKLVTALDEYTETKNVEEISSFTNIHPKEVLEMALKLAKENILEALPGNRYRLTA